MRSDDALARSRVRVLVLTGLGLNCEDETAKAFELCGATVDRVHLSDMLQSPERLGDYHILALVGGFSFGDHIAAGVVYANRIRSRMHDALQSYITKKGLILGICNGFQTMVKLGLLPGLDGDYVVQRATLAANDRLGYYDTWVRLVVEPASPCIWTRGIERMELPSRHGEGKFLTETAALLARIESEGLVAVRYADAQWQPTQEWPHNPNGSPGAIAGVCDPSGLLFGMMPHPDAFLYGFHHPQWTRRKVEGTLQDRGDGLLIFQNGVDHVARELAASAH